MRIEATAEQLKQAAEATADDPVWAASRAVLARGERPSEMFRTLAVRPDILRALSGLDNAVYPGGLLERPLKERVIVETSRANACQYCTVSHAGTLQRLGFDADPLATLDDPSGLPAREQAALAYARAAVADSNRVPDALFARLQEQFSDAEIVELTFLVGLTCLLNLFNNCLHVRYNDDYAALAAS